MGFVLPFANFILDTTFTLFRRLIRREKWYQAHRSHFYQRMTDLGMTLHPGRFCGSNRPRRVALAKCESPLPGGFRTLGVMLGAYSGANSIHP
jgi:hypothetical protein